MRVSNKDQQKMIKNLNRELKRRGEELSVISRKNSGHYRLDFLKDYVIMSSTPSCPFAIKKTNASIQRILKAA